MDMDHNPPVSVLKRLFFCALLLAILSALGGFLALTSTNPKIPHPWGEIRLMQFSTNNATTLAHFRFRNLFEWPAFLEVGLEVRTDRGWQLARGYTLFVPIERPVGPRSTQNFSVPVPFDCKEWRVLVRAAKANPSLTELRREKIKHWLASHHAGVLAQRIEIQDPNGYIMPGPDMRFDKAGRLPTPYYAIMPR